MDRKLEQLEATLNSINVLNAGKKLEEAIALDILPPLVAALHRLRALVSCRENSAVIKHLLADMGRLVSGIRYNHFCFRKCFRYLVVYLIKLLGLCTVRVKLAVEHTGCPLFAYPEGLMSRQLQNGYATSITRAECCALQ